VVLDRGPREGEEARREWRSAEVSLRGWTRRDATRLGTARRDAGPAARHVPIQDKTTTGTSSRRVRCFRRVLTGGGGWRSPAFCLRRRVALARTTRRRTGLVVWSVPFRVRPFAASSSARRDDRSECLARRATEWMPSLFVSPSGLRRIFRICHGFKVWTGRPAAVRIWYDARAAFAEQRRWDWMESRFCTGAPRLLV